MFRIPRSLRPLIAAGAIAAALAAVLPTPRAGALELPARAGQAPVPHLPLSGLLRLLAARVARQPQARGMVRRARAIGTAAMARRMAPVGDPRRAARRHDAAIT